MIKSAFPLALLALSLLFLMGTSCTSTSMSNEEIKKTNSIIVLKGKISVKGIHPHTWLCLTDQQNSDYKLVGKLVKQIQDNYQQQIVTLEGSLLTESSGPFPSTFQVKRVVLTTQ